MIESLWNEALKHWQRGETDASLQCCQRILEQDNTHAGAHHMRALIAFRQGDWQTASTEAAAAIKAFPDNPHFHNTHGAALIEWKHFDLAQQAFQSAIRLDPNHAEAHNNLGNLLKGKNDLSKALFHYEAACRSRPEYHEAWHNRGVVHLLKGDWNKAISHLQRALELNPDDPETLLCLGTCLSEQGNLKEAEPLLRKALVQKGGTPEILHELALTLQRLNRHSEAIGYYRQLVEQKPEDFGVLNNLGLSLYSAGLLEEAIVIYKRSIALNPEFPVTYLNIGNLYKDQNRWDEALACYKKALQFKPDYIEAHNNMGLIFQIQGHLPAAIQCFDSVLAMVPEFHGACVNRANALSELGRHEEVISSLRGLIACQPDYHSVHDNLLFVLSHHPNIPPETIFEEHLRWAKQHTHNLPPPFHFYDHSRDPDRPLRIGYLSPDFYGHVVALNLFPILSNHERSRFEIVCYSNTQREDMITERLKWHATLWRNIRHETDETVCEWIRSDRIDILIDLAGHTAHNRLLVFARKPVPIQISYLGYIQTTGLTQIDYRLTDEHGDPEGTTDPFYTEKLIRLPGSAICYDSMQGSPEVQPPPFLKQKKITFLSFNNLNKINDEVIGLWSRLLQEVESSTLLLKAKPLIDSKVATWIQQRFEHHGIDQRRIEFAGWVGSNLEHLQWYGKGDIALDPFPFNGGITSFDALWMGVPVVTLAGYHFASRMGVRLLAEIGLKELIAHSKDEYIQIASTLARDPGRLQALRSTLRDRIRQSPLMDGPKTTQNLENALRLAWTKWCQQTA